MIHFTADGFHGGSSIEIADVQPVGVPISINLEDLIEEVVLSPECSDKFEREVRGLADSSGIGFEVSKSKLIRSHPSNWRLRYADLSAVFRRASWTSVEEDKSGFES